MTQTLKVNDTRNSETYSVWRGHEGVPRRARPVLWWATLGGAALAMQLYVYLAWILSNDFTAIPTGADPVPDSLQVRALILQVVFGLAALGAVIWVVRSCIRERRLSLDAKIFIGWCSVLWIDQTANWIRPQVIFNSAYLNLGSWYSKIPGWIAPNSELLPAPFFIEWATYIFMVVVTFGGCQFMIQVRRKWPTLGKVGLIGLTWLAMSVFVLVIEGLCVWFGNVFVWIGSVHALTLWAGTAYALPLTEVFGWGATITAMVALRYSRVEDGELFVDRGLDRVQCRPKWMATISALAVIGFATIAQGVYGAMSAPLTLYNNQTAEFPTYILNGICGKETPYECPGPGVPIPLNEEALTRLRRQ